jgi:hypothetical protein
LLEVTPIWLQDELAQARRPQSRRQGSHLRFDLGIEVESRYIETGRLPWLPP